MKKKRLLIIMIVLVLILPVGITFSRYVVQNIRNYILEANNFFFDSDKLVQGGIIYEINNWGGAGNIEIQFELNNHKNNILTSDSDIVYTITKGCDEGLICSLSSSSGTIQKAEKTDNFVFTLTPTRTFNDNESVTVSVTAQSTSPYVKTLSATFVITVGRRGIDYEITDSRNSPYLLFRITNALDTYKVIEAFGSYSVGDSITTQTYLGLSAANRAKCASAMITLSFDPTVVILDTTSDILKKSTYQTTNVGGVAYISSITFPIDVMTSEEIRFYKINSSNNYTYPVVTSTPVISFTAT